jgi:hypothetical protein
MSMRKAGRRLYRVGRQKAVIKKRVKSTSRFRLRNRSRYERGAEGGSWRRPAAAARPPSGAPSPQLCTAWPAPHWQHFRYRRSWISIRIGHDWARLVPSKRVQVFHDRASHFSRATQDPQIVRRKATLNAPLGRRALAIEQVGNWSLQDRRPFRYTDEVLGEEPWTTKKNGNWKNS